MHTTGVYGKHFVIIVFSLAIFPIIYTSYKQMNKDKQELLYSNIKTIKSLGNAIALRDSDTNEHNYRVTLYSIKLAEELRLSSNEIQKIIKGALLHDAGKIAISDTILLKDAGLSENEQEIMKEHVTKGLELIKDNSWLDDRSSSRHCSKANAKDRH